MPKWPSSTSSSMTSTVSGITPSTQEHQITDAVNLSQSLSDSQIAAALNTSLATIARTRQQLVEDGLEAVLTRKHSPASARTRIVDGAAEARLLALACSEPPKGRARWTSSLLEDKVVELNIVAKASDNTIGRTLKKRAQTASEAAIRHSTAMPAPRSWPPWKTGLSQAARSGSSHGLRGRNLKAAHRRDARADPGQARAA